MRKPSTKKRFFSLGLALTLLVSLFSGVTVQADLYPGNTDISRRVATQGMVLLENKNQALPLQEGESVVLFGNRHLFNDSMFTGFLKGGGGSGDVYGSPVKDILTGLEKKEAESRLTVYKGLTDKYRRHLKMNKLIPNELKLKDDEVVEAAQQAGTAIITLGRWTSETFDHKAEAGDYYLNDKEKRLLNQVTSAGFDKVIVLLNIGTVMDTSWIKDYPAIDAVLLTWFPGTEGGLAIADVLCGDVNPSGKLATTFAKRYRDYPTYGSFYESRDYVNYREDIFVGYRYFETFDPTYQTVNYPFGYGLSYTTFQMSDVVVNDNGSDITVEVTATNTGEVAGKEVIQVYFSAPQGRLGKPGKELAAFAKTGLLEAGQSERLTMQFPINEMASYDDTGKVAKSAYLLESGDYQIYVGNSIKQATENGSYYTHVEPSLRIVEQLQQRVAPTRLDERLLANGQYEKLEKISLKPIFSIDENQGQPAVNRIEGEDYQAAHWGVKVESFSVDGQTGQSLAKMNDFLGTWVDYELDVKEAGDYQLGLRAANGHWPIKDMLEIFVDDVKVDNVYLDMPKTGEGVLKGEWHQYIDTDKLKIYLPAGKVKLTFKSKNHGFANIDYFTVEKEKAEGEDTTPDGQTADVSSESTMVAENRSAGKLQLIDVYHNRTLMERFLNQMTDGQVASLLGGKLPKLPGGTGTIADIKEFGIPAIQTADGPAGVRLSTGGTAWPCATLQACTFDQPLIYEVGVAAGVEAKYNDVDIWLAPGMNIHRDPLCGRNFEYYSEDPLLSGKMAIALTKGVQEQGVLITIKHFIANNKEVNRNSSDSRMSERALREIYLKSFEMTVKSANPRCLMTSYNLVNGYETSANKELLTGILREEWGYRGLVMTDWFNQSTNAEEVYAGNDVKMPFGSTLNLLDSLHRHLISRQDLERSAKRVLEAVMDTPLFRQTHGLELMDGSY